MADLTQGVTDIIEVFKTGNQDQIAQVLDDLNKRFNIHDHDGRNSLNIDVLANEKSIQLSALAPFSDHSDGDFSVTATTTLTRDMFYGHLIIQNGGILQPASFRIFADIIEIQAGGIIQNNGNAGGSGADGAGVGTGNAAGGTAGAQVSSGSLPGGSIGKVGGTGGKGHAGGSGFDSGTAGANGDSVTKSIGAAGSGGGGGGNSNGNSGSGGGNGGSQVGTVLNVPRSLQSAYQLSDNSYPKNVSGYSSSSAAKGIATINFSSAHGLLDGDIVNITGATTNAEINGTKIVTYSSTTAIKVECGTDNAGAESGTLVVNQLGSVRALGGSAGSGGGGGGCGGTGDTGVTGGDGGGGGGSGSTGGVITIFARQIVHSGTISAVGGAGGNGGKGFDGSGANSSGGGGGGGGAGGAGGVVILVYGDLSGPGTITVAGGALGAGGAHGVNQGTSTSVNGADGGAGSAGTIIKVQVSNLS